MHKTSTYLYLLVASLLFGTAPALRAQSLDPAFTPTVLKAPMTAAQQSRVNTLAVQPDGKYLVAGGFDFVNGALTGKLQRFNPDGTVDASFMPGTGANGTISALVLQPDGKILLAGMFTSFNGTPATSLVRLNANGTVDNTFSSQGSGVALDPRAVALQPDGKILVGGFDLDATQMYRFRASLVRLNANGTRDAGFAAFSGGDYSGVLAVLAQPDGTIMVGGSFSEVNGQVTGGVVRLLANGALDSTFSTATTWSYGGYVYSLLRQPSGKLLVGGNFYFNGLPTQLLRLLPSGAPDNTFTPGTAPSGNVAGMVQQSSGAVLLTGSFAQYNGTARGSLARVSADGVLDATFAPNAGANGPVQALAETSSGQLLIGGGFTQYNGTAQPALARLSASGTLDPGFAPLIECRGTVQQAFPLPSGQLLVAGNLSAINGAALPGLATLPRRLNADGSPDPSYAPGAAGSLQAALPTGGCYVLNYNTSTLRRLLPAGPVDNGFALLPLDGRTTGTASAGTSLTGAAVQPDGKLLVYGTFTSYNGVPRNGLARLLPDGSLDASFVPPASAGLPTSLLGARSINAAFVLANGQILCYWSNYSGGAQYKLTRLNADGTEDNTFVFGTGPGTAAGPMNYFSLIPQPDGRIIVWGGFTSFNGQPTPYGLTRLTLTGAVDPTFSGLNDFYWPRYVQPDGGILVTTGNISGSILGAGPASQLIRLTPDGSPDGSFTPVAMPSSIFGGDDHLLGITQQPADGKLLLYGSFRYVAGQVRIGLARLTAAPLATAPASSRPQALTFYPNPAHDYATAQLPAGATQLRVLDLRGRLVRQRQLPARQSEATVDLNGMPAGLYLVQVVGAAGLYQARVVVTQ